MANLKGGTVVGNFRAVHTGNIIKILKARDGHGSGIDADLLDGRHASDFSLTSHNHDSAYVRKSGDLMTGYLHFDNRTASTPNPSYLSLCGYGLYSIASMRFYADTDNGNANNEFLHFAVSEGTTPGRDKGLLIYRDDIKFKNNTVWHAGNDGNGSGLDADLLDGVQSDRIPYGRNDTCTNVTDDTNKLWKAGFYEMNGGANAPVSGSDWWWMAKLAHGSNRSDYRYGTVIAGRNGYNQLFFKNAKQDGTGTWCQLWHNNNMGHNSGLDADMVDGIQSDRIVHGDNNTATANANTIDNIIKSGFYRPNNAITTTNNTLPENTHCGIIHCANTNYSNYFFQIAVPYDVNNKIYFRNKINGDLTQWHRIYHTENKPTPAEVGAVNKSGDSISGHLQFTGSSSNIKIVIPKDNTSWARGVDYNSTSGGQLAAIGVYGTGERADSIYLGFEAPAGSTGLKIDRTNCFYKNNKIWHAGNQGHGSGMNADMIDGKHWSDVESTFVKKSGDVMTGPLEIGTAGANALQLYARGGGDHVYLSLYPRTNSNSRGGYLGYGSSGTTVLTLNNEIGSLQLYSHNDTIDMNGIIFDKSDRNPSSTNRLNISAYVHATRFYGAVYNDYAEYFEKDKNEEFEPGDLICLDESSDEEVYIKSKKPYSPNVVGVYSDEYAQCIGGKGDGKDEENYLPIGLAGRVRVKVIGKVSKGDLLVSSGVEGYAMASTKYIPGTVIGKALENKTSIGEGKVRMLINLQ